MDYKLLILIGINRSNSDTVKAFVLTPLMTKNIISIGVTTKAI